MSTTDLMASNVGRSIMLGAMLVAPLYRTGYPWAGGPGWQDRLRAEFAALDAADAARKTAARANT